MFESNWEYVTTMVSVATSVGVSVNVFTFAHQNKFNKSTSKKTQKMNQENPKMRKWKKNQNIM